MVVWYRNCTDYAVNVTDCDVEAVMNHEIARITISLGVIGSACCFSAYICTSLYTIVADRVTRRVRQMAFTNILRQHIGYFDIHQAGELNTRLTQYDNLLLLRSTRPFFNHRQWYIEYNGFGLWLGFIWPKVPTLAWFSLCACRPWTPDRPTQCSLWPKLFLLGHDARPYSRHALYRCIWKWSSSRYRINIEF